MAIGVGKRHSRVGRQWWFLKLALASRDEKFLVDTRPLHTVPIRALIIPRYIVSYVLQCQY